MLLGVIVSVLPLAPVSQEIVPSQFEAVMLPASPGQTETEVTEGLGFGATVTVIVVLPPVQPSDVLQLTV